MLFVGMPWELVSAGCAELRFAPASLTGIAGNLKIYPKTVELPNFPTSIATLAT